MGFGVFGEPDLYRQVTAQTDNRSDCARQLTRRTIMQTLEFTKQGFED